MRGRLAAPQGNVGSSRDPTSYYQLYMMHSPRYLTYMTNRLCSRGALRMEHGWKFHYRSNLTGGNLTLCLLLLASLTDLLPPRTLALCLCRLHRFLPLPGWRSREMNEILFYWEVDSTDKNRICIINSVCCVENLCCEDNSKMGGRFKDARISQGCQDNSRVSG